MPRRLPAVLVCLALTGCSDPAPEPPPPHASATAPVSVPADGVLLRQLGFRHAPADLSVPAGSEITQRVDQVNTVTAVMTVPGGLEIAAYLRRTLPAQGWTITDDANNSLLFERGDVRGAFTVTDATAALAIRHDAQS